MLSAATKLWLEEAANARWITHRGKVIAMLADAVLLQEIEITALRQVIENA